VGEFSHFWSQLNHERLPKGLIPVINAVNITINLEKPLFKLQKAAPDGSGLQNIDK